MPQMMPIYWFVVCLMVNLSIHFFSSFYYHNFLVFSSIFSFVKVSEKEVNFLK